MGVPLEETYDGLEEGATDFAGSAPDALVLSMGAALQGEDILCGSLQSPLEWAVFCVATAAGTVAGSIYNYLLNRAGKDLKNGEESKVPRWVRRVALGVWMLFLAGDAVMAGKANALSFLAILLLALGKAYKSFRFDGSAVLYGGKEKIAVPDIPVLGQILIKFLDYLTRFAYPLLAAALCALSFQTLVVDWICLMPSMFSLIHPLSFLALVIGAVFASAQLYVTSHYDLQRAKEDELGTGCRPWMQTMVWPVNRCRLFFERHPKVAIIFNTVAQGTLYTTTGLSGIKMLTGITLLSVAAGPAGWIAAVCMMLMAGVAGVAASYRRVEGIKEYKAEKDKDSDLGFFIQTSVEAASPAG